MNVDDENLVMVVSSLGQTVVVNHDIRVTILGMHGNQVRIGFNSRQKLVVETLRACSEMKGN